MALSSQVMDTGGLEVMQVDQDNQMKSDGIVSCE